jgi:hypothetical protein
MVATALVGGLVLFELIYVSSLASCNDHVDLAFILSAGVSAIFFIEIVLRYYTWRHSVRLLVAEDLETKRAPDETQFESLGLGGFFNNNVSPASSFS